MEPMAPDRRVRWKKEIDWLLSVTDHVVEFVPSRQTSKEGITMDVIRLFSLPFFLPSFIDRLWILNFILLQFHPPENADYGDKTKKGSPYEHTCSEETRRHANCEFF